MKLRSGGKYVSPAQTRPGKHRPIRPKPKKRTTPAKNPGARERTIAAPRRKKLFSSSYNSRAKSTDPAFPGYLMECGVRYEVADTIPPKDTDTLQEMLTRPRDSPPPTPGDFNDYTEAIVQAQNEATAQHRPWELLSKRRATIPAHYATDHNVEWTNADNPFIARGLPNPRPDISQSFRFSSYSGPVRESDVGILLALNDNDGGALPSFAGEFNVPGDSLKQARCETAYYGATMVAAWINVHDAINIPNHGTHALTFISDGRTLEVFANHRVHGQFYQHSMGRLRPDRSIDQLHKARTLLRNAQDWAYITQTALKLALEKHYAV